MNKRPFLPAFLQNFDDKLLHTKPSTWSARAHLVLYFALLFGLVLAAFCFLVFFDAKQNSSLGGWATLVSLIAFIGFVFWLIFLLRFNVFKRFGNWFAWDGLKSFALYFTSIGAMVAVCFIPLSIASLRANQQFGNIEIVNDINDMNTIACQLEYKLLPAEWDADTCMVKNRTGIVAMPDTVTEPVAEDISYLHLNSYRIIDSAELSTMIKTTDSLVKLNDSLYIFYKCPDYQFVSSYLAGKHSSAKILSSKDIYYAVLKNYKAPANTTLLKKRMEELKTKYAVNSYYSSNYEFEVSYNEKDNYTTKINKKYNLPNIGQGIDNIVQKKYAWAEDWDIYLRIFYYTTMLLTLLVFIFRHTTVKTFFLSVLTSVVLFIITSLLMVLSNGSETSVYSFMIVYYGIFAIVALSLFTAGSRRAVQGIGLNLFVLLTPFIPLIFMALNTAIDRNSTGYYVRASYKTTELYFSISEIAGGLIFLILLEPLFRKLYRKWYAAPGE
jgi:hypothetical protein